MKTQLIFFLVPAMVLAACERAEHEVSPTGRGRIGTEQAMQEQLDSNAVLSFRLGSEPGDPDCTLPVCSLLIQEQSAILQAQANDLCQPLFNCVECCLEGWLVYATLYAEPTAPKCKMPDWNSSVLENLQ